ncbi:putative guanine nucleotide-binding protein gamma subunit [Serendipita vermifera]|nr:putative guanine nucleotide-binding protein gamma subunit [Serendipita vermifera]
MSMSSRQPKQSMSELKLRRVTEHIQRLRDDLARPRIRVSEASMSLIRYTRATRDPLIPAVWGPLPKNEDPFYQPQNTGCGCVLA